MLSPAPQLVGIRCACGRLVAQAIPELRATVTELPTRADYGGTGALLVCPRCGRLLEVAITAKAAA